MTGDEVTGCGDVDRLVAPIVLAFAADPFVRWLLPGSSEFLSVFPRITRLHAERTTAAGGAYLRRDGCGAALWYPPGVRPDGEALGGVLREGGMVEKVSMVFQEVAAHEPSEPHWYLRQIGVDPRLQRSGHGSALLRAGLTEVDRRQEPAYLEATGTSSRTFYERHGFTVLGEVEVGDAPPLWPMVRHARTE